MRKLWVNGVLLQVSRTLEKQQRRYAGYLNRKAADLSRRKLIIGLVLFCVGFGGAAVCVGIWSLFHGEGRGRTPVIRVPAHAVVVDTLPPIRLPSQQLSRIGIFERYMDSLRYSATGKQVYDSIQRVRPGLIDSLALFNNMYNP